MTTINAAWLPRLHSLTGNYHHLHDDITKLTARRSIIMRTRESIDNEAQKFVEASTIQREILDQTQLMKLV